MNETAQKILGYIKRLPETWDGQPLRQQALDNFDEWFASSSSFKEEYDTIGAAFYWRDSKEGYEYWSKISELLINGTIQLLPDVEEKKEEKKEEFVWTDELALEFSVSHYSTISPLRDGLEQFKASKQRKPLFVTEDEKQIFEGDKFWLVSKSFVILEFEAAEYSKKEPELQYFSTEPAAREYVRLNKPMYSLKQIEHAFMCCEAVTGNLKKLITELEKLKP